MSRIVPPPPKVDISAVLQIPSSLPGPSGGIVVGAPQSVPSHRPVASQPMSSPVHVFHRLPADANADRRSPRSFSPDEFMAIEPRALERAFFPGFFDDVETKPYDMSGAVAIIDIDGPLMQRGGYWWDGYEAIRGRFEAALADKAAGAIILKISSPGGVVSGCFAQSRAMRAAKEAAGKPVYAYADESAYSAAYAMACIADKIYLPREGGVGSVGVIGVLEDWTKFNDQMGIKVAVITSGKHKADGHPDVELKQDVIARYQTRINQLADSFIEVVADARGLAKADVRALEADCFYGDDAVRVGLADAVQSYEDVLALATVAAASRVVSAPAQSRQAAALQLIVNVG